MRAPIVLFIVAFFAGFPSMNAEVKSGEDQTNAYVVLGDLPKEDAARKASEMAEKDFAANTFRVLVAGMRRQQDSYDNYLKKKYGVMVTSVTGCVVSEGIIGAIEGYNSTMKPLLIQKFGRDIFKEAEEAGRK